ncbi:Hypothetical protein FKW44_015778, partial [Caligus rogercresseyi]
SLQIQLTPPDHCSHARQADLDKGDAFHEDDLNRLYYSSSTSTTSIKQEDLDPCTQHKGIDIFMIILRVHSSLRIMIRY